MAMDKTKVLRHAVHVYFKVRTDPNTAEAHATADGWVDVGSIEGKASKFTPEPYTYPTQDSDDNHAGLKQTFETAALEIDATKLTSLETMIGEKCDVLLVPVNTTDTRVLKLLGFSGYIGGYDGVFHPQERLKLPIKMSAIGAKPSDLVSLVTIDWDL